MSALSPELLDYSQQFATIRARAEALTSGLTQEAFNWRPGPDRWSVAECIEHLSVTGERVMAMTIPVIERGRQAGRTASGPFHYGWFARWFESALEPPPKRRFKTPKPFAPAPSTSYDKGQVMRRFVELGEAWERALHASNGLDLQGLKVQSAASRLFRYPLGANFRIQTAHERRHLWQAEQVIAAPGFPGNR